MLNKSEETRSDAFLKYQFKELEIEELDSKSKHGDPGDPVDNRTNCLDDIMLDTKPRDQWDNGVEFLMSCISMSIGLGNVWRFPYEAYNNGGGAFLIPYIIVLFIIGKPLYYMEMILGQFSSKGIVKAYDMVPALRGNGVAQAFAVGCVMTYYASVMALIVYYLFASFSWVLPWTVCDPSWTDCFSSSVINPENSTGLRSSSELYFTKTVLKIVDNIDDGIGTPDWKLAICLIFAWIAVFLVVVKGVKSSGKASYFLAIFPYVIMIVLLVRAITLPGASTGILYFIMPDFEKILDPHVWYKAVTQCFFSLSICFGVVVMYSSYNNFNRNIYRDVMIVTTLDTCSSILAGCTIFGILGNLALATGKNVTDVVRGGAGLAFISYPEAISKFESAPQVFSVLFFLMLFILGIGSNVAMISCVVTVIKDRFPKIVHWHVVLVFAAIGFCIGLAYITPGGQLVLDLVDYHGAQFIAYFLGIAQCIAIAWIYGLKNFCDDIEFMLNIKPGFYWRFCWGILTPITLIVILIYTLTSNELVPYNIGKYPVIAIVCGWLLTSVGLIQWPIFAISAIIKRRYLGFPEMIIDAFRARDTWGPVNPRINKEWIIFKEGKHIERANRRGSKVRQFYDTIMGY